MSSTTIRDVVLKNSGYTEDEFDSMMFDEASNINLPIKNLSEAVALAKESVRKGMKVKIIGDYDADGVMGTSILYEGFSALNADVSTRIPRRMSEGYGLKENIIDEVEDGLLITIDNGIAAAPAIKKAKEKGLTVIVIDHHQLRNGEVIPPADIVVDPHVVYDKEEDFKDWCGAGLAYRFIQELLPDNHALMEKMLCYATIATIADCVPLKRENRFLVQNGLKNMVHPDKRTESLSALLSVYSLTNYINEKDIGFRLAPAINAPGRLFDDGASLILNFFIRDTSYKQKIEMANRLYSINRQRIELKDKQLEMAQEIIQRDMLFSTAPIMLYSKDFHEGLVGIIAGKLTEIYDVPAIVFCELEDGRLKGSGRSAREIDIFAHVDKCSDLFLGFGGHPGACGITMKKENFEEFVSRMEEGMRDVIPLSADAERTYSYDLEIEGTEVDGVMEEIRKYAPYGNRNPEVVFKINHYRLTPKGSSVYETKGDDDSTILFNGINSVAIGFFMTQDFVQQGFPKSISMIGTIRDKYCVPMFPTGGRKKKNDFSRPVKRETQVEIIDFKPETEAIKTTSLADVLKKMTLER